MEHNQLTFEFLVIEAFKNNISEFTKVLIPEMEREGYTITKPKRYLTTKEMCEMAGISYSSWTKSDVRNDERIIKMRDRDSGQAIQYKSSDIETIKAIWQEHNRKKRRGEQ